MDLVRTIENSLNDSAEYGVTDGEYYLDGNRAVYIAPPEDYATGRTSFLGDVRNYLKGKPDTFRVRIYEGDTVIESTEVGTVGEAENWLNNQLDL